MCTFYDVFNNLTQFFCTKAFQQVDQDTGRDLLDEIVLVHVVQNPHIKLPSG